MAFIEAVPEEQAGEVMAAWYAADREQRGYVPNYAKVFSRRPEAYAAWKQLGGAVDGALDPLDAEIVRFATQVATDAASVTAEDVERLRALGLSDDDILDVTLAAAARCFFSTVVEAMGAQPDAAYRAIDPELRAALTVGRPIDED